MFGRFRNPQEGKTAIEIFAQAGTIPNHITDDGLDVLLISTGSGKHFTLPKGSTDPGLSTTETALNEANELAGIQGRLVTLIMGTYGFEQ